MLSLIRKIGAPAFTLLAGAGIVGTAVLLVSLLDLLLKAEILPVDQLIGGLVALAIGPIVVFLLLQLTRSLEHSQMELRQAHEDLTLESESLRALSDDLTRANQNLDFAQRVARVGYFEVDLKHRTYRCSSEFERIFGLGQDARHDFTQLHDLVHPADRESYLDHLRLCLEQERAFSLDYRILPEGGGRETWLHVYATIAADGGERASKLTGIVQDITGRKQAENDLRETRDRLQLATDAAAFGVWDWDVCAGEVRCTPRINTIFAWDLPEIVDEGVFREQVQARMHPEDRDSSLRLMREALADAAVSYSQAYRILLPDQQIRYLHTNAYVRRDADGRPLRVVGLLQDQTEIKEVEIALAEARDRAEASNRAKSEFVANMSHEIRTPLNAVMGLTHLLRQTPLNQEQLDYLDRIGAAGRSLLGVLNDILDFSKIEAGRLEVSPAEFALPDLLNDLASMLSVGIGDKPVEILIGMADNLPQWVVGDMLRLRQVLINLAGNAVKFTEQGEVTVWVERERQDAQTCWLRFSVRDTGIGMTGEQVERLFAPFTQADASMTRRFGGTGLGLAISKRLVELMGGAIGVESRSGVGSDFWFTVPLAVSRAGEKPEPPAEDLRGLSVLVVDDHPTARLFIRSAVEHLQWHADLARSGEEAVRRFRERRADGHPHDVALVDWKMPGMDGIETIAAIKRIADPDSPPIAILVTAHAYDEIGRREEAHAIDGMMVKPVTCQALLKLVADRRRCRRVSSDLGGSLAAPSNADKPLQGRRLLLVEDNAVNQMVALRILQQAGAQVELAEDGRQALDHLAADSLTPFDLVLMDVQMPTMDGLTATRLIREQLQLDLPVIAMSAGVMPSEKERCLASGMDDFVGKPFSVPDIIAMIQRHCRTPAERDESGTPKSSQVPEEVSGTHRDLVVPGFDLSATLRRFGNDRALLETALSVFGREFQNLPAVLEQLSAAGSSVEMQQLLHRFRGAAANLGGVELCRYTEAVESALAAGQPYQDQLGALVATWRAQRPFLPVAPAKDPASVSLAGGV